MSGPGGGSGPNPSNTNLPSLIVSGSAHTFLEINSAAGFDSGFQLQKDNQTYWQVKNSHAAGDDFVIRDYGSANVLTLKDGSLDAAIETTSTGVSLGGVTTLAIGGHTPKAPTLITGITVANPGVITAAGHGLSNGDRISIMGVKGMVEVDGPNSFQTDQWDWITHTVAGVSGANFNIGVDTRGHTAWSEGGIISTPVDLGASNNCGGLCSLTSNTRSGFLTITLGAQLDTSTSASLKIVSNKIKDGDVVLLQIMDTANDTLVALASFSTWAIVEGSFVINIYNSTGSHLADNSVVNLTWIAL